jgi:hypothetical protein
MNLRTLFLSAPLAVVVACGGSASTGSGSDNLDAATPSYAALAFDQTAADATPPAAALVGEVSGAASMQGPGGGCHPHLFMREREVVERVNRHVYKVLRKVERLIATIPADQTSVSKTWTRTETGVDVSFSVKLVGPNVYSWELAAGPTGTTPLPVVMTGEIDRTGATGEHEGKGGMEIDFAKLNAAFPQERVASGTLSVEFDVTASSRKISVVADQLVWDLDASHFDGGVIPSGLTQPRSGSYVYFREPLKGGSLKIQDQMVFVCGLAPGMTNPGLVPADAQMVSRWFKAADGTVHGRSDGLIQGGQLVAPVDRIVGVTCHNAAAERHMPTEGYWLMKAEDASGATLAGANATSMMDASATPCDPTFGAVPTLENANDDFKAWPTSYADDTPYPFPGM